MNSNVTSQQVPRAEGYDIASIGSHGDIYCTDSEVLDRFEHTLRAIAPGTKCVEERYYFDGKRCGLRFEKSLDVFFRQRVVWWMTQQLSASGWELLSVDAGTLYFKRKRIA